MALAPATHQNNSTICVQSVPMHDSSSSVRPSQSAAFIPSVLAMYSTYLYERWPIHNGGRSALHVILIVFVLAKCSYNHDINSTNGPQFGLADSA